MIVYHGSTEIRTRVASPRCVIHALSHRSHFLIVSASLIQ